MATGQLNNSLIAKDSANNAEVTLATQIEGETTGYGVLATGGYEASNKTASAVIKNAAGVLKGFYVNSTSSGTIVFYNDDTTTNPTPALTGTITPAIGWHELGGINCSVGITAVIANTLNVTIVYK